MRGHHQTNPRGNTLLLLSQIISPERSRGNYVSATITLPLSQVGKAPDFDSGIFAGSSPAGAANTTWTPRVDSVSGIVVWVLGSPERSLINLDVLLRRKAVPSKARILKRRGNYDSAIFYY